MDICEDASVTYTEDGYSQECDIESTAKHSTESTGSIIVETKLSNGSTEKQCAVWTTESTIILLKAYEAKLEMLETPKKKTRIWIAISEYLKEHDFDVTPDQVRWKINALAKKYKQCVDSGEHTRFKYFKEMDDIYSRFNVECTDYSLVNAERVDRMRQAGKCLSNSTVKESNIRLNAENKALIELRKVRLANRIEADRSQSKISFEKQWLKYLTRQEEQKRWRDEIFERSLKLKEEELELRKRELEMKESLEIKRLDIKERDQEQMLQIEREKCEILKQFFSHHH